jgi:proline dehydrogenase
MHKVSQRYVAGQTVAEALQRVEQIIARGHAASAEYMGESVRDEAFALAETDVFMELVRGIGQRNLNCSISFDLSHVGALVDTELGYRNARRIALAAAEINREVMIPSKAPTAPTISTPSTPACINRTICATSASPYRPSACALSRTCRR